MEDYGQRFSGIGRLYGLNAMERLRQAHVCVVGIGGVGSWTVEALARSGVGHLTLIDLDDVCVTNTNRQLHALDGEVGKQKVDVMAERVRRINPGCEVVTISDFFNASSAARLLHEGSGFDYVVDAIDQPQNKCLLVERCRALGIPVVIVGGAGGRRDPSRVRVDDLSRTEGDALLRRVRKQLRPLFPSRKRWGIPCVFTDEPPRFPSADGGTCDKPDPSVSLRLDCASGFGTATFVTGTVGFMAAAVVVNALGEAAEG